jgi:uncharacterized phiE125 gp8 family phage protein
MKDCFLVTDATVLPVTLEQINQHIKFTIPSSTSDNLNKYAMLLLKACVKYGEKYTGIDFLNKTYRAFYNTWYDDARNERVLNNPFSENYFELLKQPLVSITSLKYLLGGALQTVLSSKYYITKSLYNAKLVFKSTFDYPATDEQMQCIQVDFVAGLADGTTILLPDDIQLAILNHFARVWANRGDCDESGALQSANVNSLVITNLPPETAQVYNIYKVLDIEL